jgi:transposase InsO family protein
MDQKSSILDYVYNNPTHGPLKIANEQRPPISGKAVWSYLVKEDLNTRRKRRLWAHNKGKPVLTQKEVHCISARYRHIKSTKPAQLVSMDTFWLNIKDLGRIYQYTACDTYSSYGWAKAYLARHSDNSIDFFKNHVMKDAPTFRIRRVLTDQGTEFYSCLSRRFDHYFTDYLKRQGIRHIVTKRAHPWTNGYAERLNQTIWEEFYLCRLSHPYGSLDALNDELQKFMMDYNFTRRHTGYKLKAGNFQHPGYAFYGIREYLTTI